MNRLQAALPQTDKETRTFQGWTDVKTIQSRMKFPVDSVFNPRYSQFVMPVPKPRILVVDDEAAIRLVLERILQPHGYRVVQSATGREALETVAAEKPDLMILDLNLPDMNGEEICRRIRKDPDIQSIPIMILTGRSAEGLSVECLDGGADDYVSKPFDIKEMVARVKALLRRPRIYAGDESVIHKGMIAIYVGERRIVVQGKPVGKLSPKEFSLLKLLVLHAPKVLDKNTLALNAWGLSAERLHHRTLDVHMRRIRQKLGSSAARCLITVPSVGYQWTDH
jgi:DNA-binding response OmpR family regulator